MQVKVLLIVREEKLIVMISLCIHIMTSQDRICVQCVTNDLEGKTLWMFTNKYMLVETFIHAVSVRNVFTLCVA